MDGVGLDEQVAAGVIDPALGLGAAGADRGELSLRGPAERGAGGTGGLAVGVAGVGVGAGGRVGPDAGGCGGVGDTGQLVRLRAVAVGVGVLLGGAAGGGRVVGEAGAVAVAVVAVGLPVGGGPAQVGAGGGLGAVAVGRGPGLAQALEVVVVEALGVAGAAGGGVADGGDVAGVVVAVGEVGDPTVGLAGGRGDGGEPVGALGVGVVVVEGVDAVVVLGLLDLADAVVDDIVEVVAPSSVLLSLLRALAANASGLRSRFVSADSCLARSQSHNRRRKGHRLRLPETARSPSPKSWTHSIPRSLAHLVALQGGRPHTAAGHRPPPDALRPSSDPTSQPPGCIQPAKP